MKIVKILGGLGNQMFQYAFYIALCQRHTDEEIKIDLNSFRGYRLHNGFEVERIFRLPPAPRSSIADLLKLAWPYLHYRLWQLGSRVLPQRSSMCVEARNMAYCPQVFDDEGDTYYDGYWQDDRYFAEAIDEVKRAFSFPPFADVRNIEIAQVIQSSHSVGIHIRRGDYLKHKKYAGTCPASYYDAALQTILRQHTVDNIYVFCNDRTWYGTHIAPLLQDYDVTYVDWNLRQDSYRDMQLMSLCQHLIIANSTFSWWAAKLHQRDNGTIVAPKRWFAYDHYHVSLPEGWMAI